jgi:endonuclease/exonuclease/phosphatase family metal-dependent hydrolase
VTLRVLTLNLWHDQGPWPERRKRIQEWLDRLEPDLIGLQEVLRGPGVDQVGELFEGRGFHLDYGVARPGWRKPEIAFGNAVASRFPIRSREELPLADGGDGETRAALSVSVEAPFGEVAFTVTHLNWRFHHGAVRERQIVEVCDFARRRRPRKGFPPLLVGDLNADPESAEIRYAVGLQSLHGRSVHFRDAWRSAGDGGPGYTWSNRNPYAQPWLEPDRRIDYVLVGPPAASGAGHVERCAVVCDEPVGGVWPSDHFGVFAELCTQPLPGRS